jgi:hypothetical protein
MEFEEAAAIAKQNPGSFVTRDTSGSFIVRLTNGEVVGASSNVSKKSDFSIYQHAQLGAVAFDPMFQQGAGEAWIRLFVIADGRWGLFTREDARAELSKSMSDVDFQQASVTWSVTRGRLLPLLSRKAYCHSCTAPLKAWSSPICLKCNWMKCTCGSCGCDQ